VWWQQLFSLHRFPYCSCLISMKFDQKKCFSCVRTAYHVALTAPVSTSLCSLWLALTPNCRVWVWVHFFCGTSKPQKGHRHVKTGPFEPFYFAHTDVYLSGITRAPHEVVGVHTHVHRRLHSTEIYIVTALRMESWGFINRILHVITVPRWTAMSLDR
jgi:hypothetical protein